MAYTVAGHQFNYRRQLFANTTGLTGAVTDMPLTFFPPDLTGKALASMNDVFVTASDGATLIDGWWWESKTLTAPVGHGRFDLTGGSATELVGYLYYGGVSDPGDHSNQSGTYPSSWKGFWAMNEASGNLTDATGNGYTMVKAGSPTYGQTGQVGGAILFPTTADYFQTSGNYPAQAAGSDLCWVKRSGTATAGWHYWLYPTFGRYLAAYHDGGSWMIVQYVVLTSGGWQTLTTGWQAASLLFDGNWHQIAGTYDGSNLRLYRDGALWIGPTAMSGTVSYTGPAALAKTLSTAMLQDNCAFCSAALTADQATALYQSSKASPWWTWGAETQLQAAEVDLRRRRQYQRASRP